MVALHPSPAGQGKCSPRDSLRTTPEGTLTQGGKMIFHQERLLAASLRDTVHYSQKIASGVSYNWAAPQLATRV